MQSIKACYVDLEPNKDPEHNIYGSSRVGIKNTNKRVTALAYNIQGDLPDIIIPETINPLDPVKRSLGEKQYELSNHLGNVLVTVSDRKIVGENEGETVTKYRAEVLFASDYYPFGMQMPDRNEDVISGYRYGFNGMEKDDEFKGEGNSYDFGARMYDARIGRWLSVDPLYSVFPGDSPYIFSGNCPIVLTDSQGLYKIPSTKEGDETRKNYPFLVKYLSENIENDVMSSSLIINGLIKFSQGNFDEDKIRDAVVPTPYKPDSD